MTARWKQISWTVPAALEDEVADFLGQLSGSGVTVENRSVDTFSLDTVTPSDFPTLCSYLPLDIDLPDKLAAIENFHTELQQAYPDATISAPTYSVIEEEDWGRSWKQHFKPLKVGQRLVVKPGWEEYSPAPGEVVVVVDPGMAFGTGTHETTRLCMQALEKRAEQPRALGKVLDVGTGSGILAVAAAKLGAKHVEGIDIDDRAVEAALDNAVINSVDDVVTVSGIPLADIHERFDTVVANILAEDLVRMAAELVRCVASEGVLILSGILIEKEAAVLAAYAVLGFRPDAIAHDGEWSCLLLQRNG